MKRKPIVIFILVCLIAGLAYYFYPHAAHSAANETDNWVQAITVKPQVMAEEVTAIGTLAAPAIKITPEVAGHVNKIFFNDGQEVTAGTLLLQLDDTLERAKANSTQAQLAYAKTNYERALLLSKRGAISKQGLDEALSNLKEKEALAAENRALVSKMQLRAPFAGTVGQHKVNIGQYITLGQEVVTLLDNQQLRVEYNLPEQYLPALHLGQDVTITTPTYPNEAFYATLSFISPDIDPNNRSIMLYALIKDPKKKLASGMFVNVKQFLNQGTQSIFIPARSILVGLNGEEVYKVIAGKVATMSVKTGKRTATLVQITEGLKAGDMIITDGQLKVRNGDPVHVLLPSNVGTPA